MRLTKETLQVLFSQEGGVYQTIDYLSVDSHSQAFPAFASVCDTDFSDTHVNVSRQGVKKRRLGEDSPTTTSHSTCPAATTHSTPTRSKISTFRDADDAMCRRIWREKLCEWAYQVVDHFSLNREVVSVAMNYFDRYCTSVLAQVDSTSTTSSSVTTASHTSTTSSSVTTASPLFEKEEFGLTTMTCLAMAIKLFEHKYIFMPGTRSSMETLIKLGRGAGKLEQMEQMERKEQDILSALDWRVHPPTPQVFLNSFLSQILEADSEEEANKGLSPVLEDRCAPLRNMAVYLVEMSILDYFFVSYRPSEVARGALFCAQKMLDAVDTIDTAKQLGNDEVNEVMQSTGSNSLLVSMLQADRTPRVMDCERRLTLVYAKSDNAPSVAESATELGGCVDGSTGRTQSPISVVATCCLR